MPAVLVDIFYIFNRKIKSLPNYIYNIRHIRIGLFFAVYF